MLVEDDYLPKDVFLNIKNTLLGYSFPWFLSDKVVGKGEEHPLYGNQLFHIFYQDHKLNSNFFQLLLPLIDKMQVSSLLRIKANLMPVRPIIQESGMHIDYELFDGYTSVYYVNSNNGYTVFEDGSKVESVENRLLTFDAKQYHTGTSHTDQPYRCVINFNYHKWAK